MSFDLSSLSGLSASQIDRILLSLYRERLKKSPEEKEKADSAFCELLHEGEQKDIGRMAGILGFLHALSVFSKETRTSHTSFYQDMIQKKASTSQNDIPHLAEIGFPEGEEQAYFFAKSVFPAGRMVKCSSASQLLLELSQKNIDYAFLPLWKNGETKAENLSLIRRYPCFLIKKYSFSKGQEYGLFAKEFSILPGADTAYFSFVFNEEEGDIATVFSLFAAFGFSVRSFYAHPLKKEKRILCFLECSFSAFDPSAFRILDHVDSLCDEFLFRGIYREEGIYL